MVDKAITDLNEVESIAIADLIFLHDTSGSALGYARIDSLILPMYFADPDESDHGVAGSGRSLKDLVDSIGANQATIVFAHHGSTSTTYTLSNNETVPANIKLVFQRGAMIGGSATLTVQGEIDAGRQQIVTGTATLALDSTTKQTFVYPEWWGPNTTPGTTDMTTEIQAAINCAETGTSGNHGAPAVLLAPTSYFVSATLTCDASGVGIKCMEGVADIIRTGTYGETIHFNPSGAAYIFKNHLENLSIRQTTTASTSGDYHVRFETCSQFWMRNCFLTDGWIGLYLDGSSGGTFRNIVITDTSLHSSFQANSAYVWIVGNAVYATPASLYFTDCEFFSSDGTDTNWHISSGIVIQDGDGIWFKGCHVGRVGSIDVYITPRAATSLVAAITFADCYLDGCGNGDSGKGYGLYLTGDFSGGNCKDINILNTTITGKGAADSEVGIYIATVTAPMYGIKIHGCTISGWGGRGAWFADTDVVDILFDGNYVFNNNVANNASIPNVQWADASNNFTCINNFIGSTKVSENADWGIYLGTSNTFICHGNICRNHATANTIQHTAGGNVEGTDFYLRDNMDT